MMVRNLPFVLTAAFVALSFSVLNSGCKKTEKTAKTLDELAEENEGQNTVLLPLDKTQPTKPTSKEKVQYKANGEVYVPDEFKDGKKRWKDAVTYLDGKPLGVLWFSEIAPSISQNPVWIEDVEDLPWKPGDKGPKERVIVERRYRITDYLTSLGVDIEKIKELHVLGGTHYAMRITGKDLLKFKDKFFFNFGRITHGKPILRIPSDYEANTSFDQVHGFAVYQNKKPPTLTKYSEIFFEDRVYSDIPYFGPPLRGGVRTYKDDKLAVWIKRKTLEDPKGVAERIGSWVEGPNGKELRIPMMKFLEENGTKIDDIVVGEVIFEEARMQRFKGDELKNLYFTMSPQGSGRILLGKDKIPANAVGFYTSEQPVRKSAKVPANATE